MSVTVSINKYLPGNLASSIKPKQEVCMKRFFIGSIATMMIALPVFANTGTTTTTEETQRMEETAVPSSESTIKTKKTTEEVQKMEESNSMPGEVQKQESMDSESSTTPSLDSSSSDEVQR